MFTTAELDNYINEAATRYIKESVPLDQTITKIASTHGLNRDQIARVVEGANTEVYVQLMNNSSDKYIQFENASAEKVASALFGTEKVAEVSTLDYDETPEVLYKPSMVKVAEEVTEEKKLTETEFYKEADRLTGLSAQYTNALEEVDIRFQSNSENLYNMIKQAYLSGTSFGDIRTALTSVNDSPILVTVLNDCQEKLAAELYPTKLDVEQHTTGSTNLNNPLVKQASRLLHDTEEFIALREKIAELDMDFEKLAAMSQIGMGMGAALQNIGNKLKGILPKGSSSAKNMRKGPLDFHLGTKGSPRTPNTPLPSTPPSAPVAAGSGTVTQQASSTARTGMSTLKKGLLIGGAGVAGGIGIEKTLEENRKRLAGMPMQFGSGQGA